MTNQFSPIQVTECQLYDNLKQYGHINSIGIYGLYHTINITTIKSILEVFPGGKVSIEGIERRFDMAYLKEYVESGKIIPMNILAPAPHRQSPHHILNILCDDVLLAIFESPFFNLKQLVSIANVCQRFHRIAGQVFRRKYTGNIGEIKHNAPIWFGDAVLRTFGEFISTIDIIHDCGSITMRSITNYCKNIEEILCSKRLCLECILTPRECPKLVNLHLSNMLFNDVQSIEAFFTMNPQIEELTLKNVEMTFGIGHILHHLPNLKALNLKVAISKANWDGLACFEMLTKLKSLQLQYFGYERIQRIVNAMVDGNVELERFESNGIHGDNFKLVDSICQMKSIKCIEIYAIDDESLSRLTENLKHLSEIHIQRSDVTLTGIRHALEQSKSLTKARFHTQPADNAVLHSEIITIDEMRKNQFIDLQIRIEDVQIPRQVSISI